MSNVLEESEAEKMILSLLLDAKKPLTTREIEETVQGKGKQCPDSAVRFLSKMRYKDMIKGELSVEHKGWIWWIDKKEKKWV
jgi:repressor of nif and glnA expression